MRAEEIMTRDPATCTPDTRIQDVAHLMLDHDCGEIPIIDDRETRRLVGVVTDRDITVRAVAEGRSPTDTLASEIMSSSLVTGSPDASLEECVEKMEKHQIRRLPIVDPDGRCIGMLAQADIALHGQARKTGEFVEDVSKEGRTTTRH